MILTSQSNTLKKTKRQESIAIFILAVLHIVGIFGLGSETTRPLFHFLTPFNLITSLGVILYFHREWTRGFVIYLLMIGALGWGVEVAGVQTALIFGAYSYGGTLGWSLLGVPLVMAVNWILVIYMAGMFALSLQVHPLIKSLIGATVITLLDFFMEPVAIYHDFWSWEAIEIPLQNYAAWFCISFFMLLGFHSFTQFKINRVSIILLSIQMIFFISLGLLI